jgi:hypothetical protein
LLRGFLRRNERWLGQFSFAVIPLALASIMLLALFAWESDSAAKPPVDISFNALAFVPDDGQIEPAAAREALRGLKPVKSFDTQLSEAPIWFAFTPPALPDDTAGPPLVYFPSRHTRSLSCWRGNGPEVRWAVCDAFRHAEGALTMSINSGFATTAVQPFRRPPALPRHLRRPGATCRSVHRTAANFDRGDTRAFANDMGPAGRRPDGAGDLHAAGGNGQPRTAVHRFCRLADRQCTAWRQLGRLGLGLARPSGSHRLARCHAQGHLRQQLSR